MLLSPGTSRLTPFQQFFHSEKVALPVKAPSRKHRHKNDAPFGRLFKTRTFLLLGNPSELAAERELSLERFSKTSS